MVRMHTVIAGALAALFLFTSSQAWASSLRFVKSQAGPSGRIVDNRFVFDELRNRFVFPQDKSLTVYFEWEAPPGNHTLSALWKDPDGRVVTISPDVKMETKTSELHAYWVFEVAAGMLSGVWTVEVRVDGEPGGSHSFELISPELAKPAAPVSAKPPSLDDIYQSTAARWFGFTSWIKRTAASTFPSALYLHKTR